MEQLKAYLLLQVIVASEIRGRLVTFFIVSDLAAKGLVKRDWRNRRWFTDLLNRSLSPISAASCTKGFQFCL